MQRQQAQAHIQTLDRLARRSTTTTPSLARQPPPPAVASTVLDAVPGAGGGLGLASAATTSSHTAPATGAKPSADPQQSGKDGKVGAEGFLLQNLCSEESGEEEGEAGETDRASAKQNIFIQEIFLSALNLEDSESDENNS